MSHPLLPQHAEMLGLSAVLPLLGMVRGQVTEGLLLKEMQYLEKMEEYVVCHHLWLLTSKAND